MDDPLKKYVQRNREAFDHLEPSADVLQRIKGQLTPRPIVKRGVFWRHSRRTWLVAASLLLGAILTYTWYDKTEVTLPEVNSRLAQEGSPGISSSGEVDGHTMITDAGSVPTQHIKPENVQLVVQMAETKQVKVLDVPAAEAPTASFLALHAKLVDSSSASNRLAAILEIEKSGYMDDQLLIQLSNTMNQDGNSNVRMAALALLGRHAYEPHMTDLFVKSLATQDDPLVQLGLINLLGHVDDRAVDETLFALANDPNTFAAVKDEAYTVLLYQNKL